MKSKPFNIVICPPEKVSRKAIALSKKLKGGLFVLDNEKYFPHISIYMAEFPLKNVPKVRKLLKQSAPKIKSFQIKSLGLKHVGDNYIGISYQESKDIKRLQKKIVKLLNPLRHGLMREREIAKMPELNKKQQRNVKLYGFRSVGSEFHPHLNFTKLIKFSKSAILKVNKSDFSFRIDKIGLFYLGDYGTCRKLIEVFNLS